MLLRCQEAFSQSSYQAVFPGAARRWQHPARNGVGMSLTGRPVTKRSHRSSRTGSSGNPFATGPQSRRALSDRDRLWGRMVRPDGGNVLRLATRASEARQRGSIRPRPGNQWPHRPAKKPRRSPGREHFCWQVLRVWADHPVVCAFPVGFQASHGTTHPFVGDEHRDHSPLDADLGRSLQGPGPAFLADIAPAAMQPVVPLVGTLLGERRAEPMSSQPRWCAIWGARSRRAEASNIRLRRKTKASDERHPAGIWRSSSLVTGRIPIGVLMPLLVPQ